MDSITAQRRADTIKNQLAPAQLQLIVPNGTSVDVVPSSSAQRQGKGQFEMHLQWGANKEKPDTFKVMPVEFVDKLRALLGTRVDVDEKALQPYGKDSSFHEHALPWAVVYPKSTAEVQAIVLLCNEFRVPVIAYGAGTSLEGHIIPYEGGIMIEFRRYMNNIVKLNLDDMDIAVQSGISYSQLNEELREKKVFFPVDPGVGATIGGMLATSCSGTNAVKYGTMKENVVNLTVVLPSGEIVKTAQRARKSAAGYDLTHLFIGSEGTLGLITEATLKLHRIPEELAVATCLFPTIELAAKCVISALQHDIHIGKVELLDETMVQALNRAWKGFNLVEKPTLMFEFSSMSHSPTANEEQSRALQVIIREHSGEQFRFENRPEQREKLWKARKQALWAAADMRPTASMWITDVVVPISRLAQCIKETKEDIARCGLVVPLVGHVGDGNFHLFILFDPNDEKEFLQAKELNDRLVHRAISMEGTCTGEHGVGFGKKKYLITEKGESAVRLMWTLKRAIDPLNLFNPGKVIPELDH